MPWYKSGTVSVVQNSTTVTGTGSAFAANARVGDAFLGPDGRWYEVVNVASDTVLSILPAYLGPTAAAGTYALAPMQGYVKDSADQLRALVNKFGTLAASAPINALAAITGAANKLAYFIAADGMALADFPAQARTLLAATTQALQRSALALGSAAVADILGTVSQSGGVPNGSLFQTISNANGTAIKFADGTMICRQTIDLGSVPISNPAGVLFASTAQAAKAFAASFSAFPTCHINLISSDATAYAGTVALPTPSASQAFYVLAPASKAQNITAVITAIGRWF